MNAVTIKGGVADGGCNVNQRYLNPRTPNYDDNDLDKHPTEYTWGGQTSYYWGNGTDANASNVNTTGNDVVGVTGAHVRKHPVKALNGYGNAYESYDDIKDFWKDIASKCVNEGQFFIDACTAYSLTSKDGDYPGNEYDFT